MPYKYAYDESTEKTYQPPKMPTNRKMWKLVLLSIVTRSEYTESFSSCRFPTIWTKFHPGATVPGP